MIIADANVYLRYLLNDVDELSSKARSIVDVEQLYLPIEVLCEIVYVLEKSIM